jgi:hypothetical protein
MRPCRRRTVQTSLGLSRLAVRACTRRRRLRPRPPSSREGSADTQCSRSWLASRLARGRFRSERGASVDPPMPPRACSRFRDRNATSALRGALTRSPGGDHHAARARVASARVLHRALAARHELVLRETAHATTAEIDVVRSRGQCRRGRLRSTRTRNNRKQCHRNADVNRSTRSGARAHGVPRCTLESTDRSGPARVVLGPPELMHRWRRALVSDRYDAAKP